MKKNSEFRSNGVPARSWMTAAALSTFLLLSACAGDNTTPTQTGLDQSEARVAEAEPIDGQYIVMFEPGALQARKSSGSDSLDGLVRSLLAVLLERESIVVAVLEIIEGALVLLTPEEAAALAERPEVRLVEQDQMMRTQRVTQTNATWGLDRIDQRQLPLDGQYTYPVAAGQGTNIYIIDTGILPSHADFGNRVIGGRNFVVDGPLGALPIPIIGGILDGLLGGLLGGEVDPDNFSDCNGHGTHVAGSAAGNTWGVAKQARLWAVRVLGCNGGGANSGVIAGVQWVRDNHVKPAVANMSLGGGNSDALDQAVRQTVAAGVTMVVAAGNDNANACSGSPNRVAEAITVGSTTNTDARSSFSNFGQCVDIFAPGTNITSAWHTGNTATSTISGTSMAAPHVAGAAALYAGRNPGASPGNVFSYVLDQSTTGVLSGIGNGSPNRLLYVD
jgi:subtilisin family serine protease